MAIWIIALALGAALAAGVLLWYRRTNARPKTPAKVPRKQGRYRAVLIRYEEQACHAVKTLKGKTILAQEAPALPLPGCTAKQCACKYVHLEDRRQDERRAVVIRFFVDSGDSDRRTDGDRRAS